VTFFEADTQLYWQQKQCYPNLNYSYRRKWSQ